MDRRPTTALILRFLDGCASSSEFQRLNELLQDDESVRQEFVELCQLSTALCESAASDPEGSQVRPGGANGVRILEWIPFTSIPTIAFAATAVCGVVLCSLLAFRLLPTASPNSEHVEISRDVAPAVENIAKSPSDATSQGTVVGKMTRKVDCMLMEQRWRPEPSSDILAGQTIRLSRGLMEIMLENGIKAVLEGPVTVQFLSPMQCVLLNGNVSADVPEGCEGFRIDTPSAQVTDLGTTFGVRVDEVGDTRLHVTSGEVAVRSLKEGKLGNELRVQENNGWESSTNSRFRIPQDRAHQFLPSSYLDDEVVGPVSDLPVSDGLACWFAADAGVHQDNDGRVVRWSDLSKEREQRNSAWQVREQRRPLFQPDGIGGLPTIRFEGSEFLVTQPMPTTDNQTVILVAQMLEDDRWESTGVQFLNYNGPPHLVVEYLPQRQRLVGRVFAGYRPTSSANPRHGDVALEAGKCDANLSADHVPFLLAYTYNKDEGKSAIYLDGLVQETGTADLSVAGENSKFIGCHRRSDERFLSGLISEIVIYNRDLDASDLSLVHEYLASKYGLSLPIGN